MNERIEHITKQVDEYFDDLTIEVSREAWQVKFAELIVKECMEQVWYTREDGINGNVSEVIKERMKQHFGVTE